MKSVSSLILSELLISFLFCFTASLSISLLEQRIGDWVHEKTGVGIKFESSEAVQLLTEFGLLGRDGDDRLHVQPLLPALRNLPQTPQTLTTRVEEYDLIEGFEVERSILEETEKQYIKSDKKLNRFGWN